MYDKRSSSVYDQDQNYDERDSKQYDYDQANGSVEKPGEYYYGDHQKSYDKSGSSQDYDNYS